MSARREEEAESIARAQRGDREALASLFSKYRRRVYSVAYGMVGSSDDAMDITQEVFLKAFRTLGDFAGTSAMSTWLYRITVNESIDFHRQQRTRGQRRFVPFDADQPNEAVERNLELGLGADLRAQTPQHPSAAVEQHELGAQLATALAEIPEIHRAVLLLREVEGLSYQELAETLNISIGTVMSRLFHARRKMKELMQAQGAQSPAPRSQTAANGAATEQPNGHELAGSSSHRSGERATGRSGERLVALAGLRGTREAQR